MHNRVPVPKALRLLILSNNELLQRYQAELQSIVLEANEEMMVILGLSPDAGWKLDIDKMEYIQVIPPVPSVPDAGQPVEGRED